MKIFKTKEEKEQRRIEKQQKKEAELAKRIEEDRLARERRAQEIVEMQKAEKRTTKEMEKKKDILRENGCEFGDFIIDQINCLIGVSCSEDYYGIFSAKEYLVFHFSDIVDYKTKVSQTAQTKKSGGLGGALVGGVIAGPLGAVAGAGLTQKSSTSTDDWFMIEITFKEPETQKTYITRCNPSNAYIFESINSILSNRQLYIEEEKNKNTVNAQNDLSQLKQLKELLDMGAISQEEFDAKKEQILGL